MSEFTAFHRGGSGSTLVLLHGFTATWQIWEPIVEALETEHDVFVPTLPLHAGGPGLDVEPGLQSLLDATEALLDEAGIETAHIVGNSLGGYAALALATRGRAKTATALAPAGGWAADDPALNQTMDFFQEMHGMITLAAPHVDSLVETPEGRAQAMQFLTEHPEVMPKELVAQVVLGAAGCVDAVDLAEMGRTANWELATEAIDCPVRMIWGTSDRILAWPTAAARFRESLPNADWIELEGVGHCPQLDVPVETAQLILDFTRD
ncbi:MAG: alpha/beta hydrolase [Solirubrobacterales bacterium]|nr:alpha/beta hydrolase [Solirubrobacterales bacterium]HMT05474.1 alpha/beta hydrolase [Solirubrobacterales bacterium]